jgi:NADPH:quinone reductase
MPAVDPRELINACTRVAGGSLFSYVGDPAELQRRGATVVDAIHSGWLKIGDAVGYELREAAVAHRDMEGRQTRGKLYLTP